jgi:hypothetical protein
MPALKFPAPLPLPNRADGSVLPAILAVVLAVLILAQFMIVDVAEQPAVAGRNIVAKTAEQRVSISVADPVILRNALFAPARGAGGSVGAGPLDGAVFAGVVRGRGFARAVLQQASGDAVSVPVNGSYHGWKLVALNNENATFVRDGIRYVAQIGRGVISANTDFQSERDIEE